MIKKISEEEKISGFKGFNPDMSCLDFQYEVGKEYEENDEIKACNKGFHFCENPFDVFYYYPPFSAKELNRFCIVNGYGEIDSDGKYSKVACSKINICAEIGLNGIIEAGVNFILQRVDWKKTNTGIYSAATNTGYQSAAINTGNKSEASVKGKDSVAIVTGYKSKAMGALGCWIVLTEHEEWNGEIYPIKEVKAFKVDGEKVKDDTWYTLINGELVETEHN